MKNYISEIINGNMKAFDALYKSYRMPITTYFRLNQGLNREDSLDLYQDICTIVLNNIKTGRLKPDSLPDLSLKAYLKKTGQFILYNRRRKRTVPMTFDSDWIMNFNDKIPQEDNSEMADKLSIIRSTIENMQMPCSKLLELKFFNEKSGTDIARIMNYANSDSVKTQLSKCRTKLRAVIDRKFKEYGYA